MSPFRFPKYSSTPIHRYISRFSLLLISFFTLWGLAVSQQLSDSSGIPNRAETVQKALQVSTNAAADELDVKLQARQNGNVQLLLLNADGRIMQRTTRFAENGRNQYTWHLRPHLPAGHYLILVESGRNEIARSSLLIR